MEQIIITVALGIVGAAMGSFAGAQVWRLRAKHLQEDKKAGAEYDKTELGRLSRLLDKGVRDDRSRCLSCGELIRWYDMAPVVSWLVLRGKCRHCHQPIGWMEFALEAVLATMFFLSFVFWPGSFDHPLEVVKLTIWLAALVPLTINFVYDLKWMALISYCNWAIIILGLMYSVVVVIQSGADWAS
ncbi:hypothetical protein B7Z28_01660, partial [Candidatus Saccharibacteria bacterium 32-45-3]